MLSVRLRSVFSPVDLSQVRSRVHYLPKPTLFDPEEMEEWKEPRVPKEIFHLDLDEYLLDYPLWYSLEKEKMGEVVTLSIGSSMESQLCPERLGSPTCYDCSRPLQLYKFALKTMDGKHGWCPGCHLVKEWEREERSHKDSQRRLGLKPNPNFVNDQRKALLASWNNEDYRWWLNEKSLNTEKYRNWRTRQMNSQLSGSTPGSSPT